MTSRRAIQIESEDLDGGGKLLRVSGEIDMDTAATLRKSVEAALQKKPKALVLAMAQVAYMDSAGLAVLIEALRHARHQKTRLVLAEPAQAVLSAVELGQLEGVFEMRATEALADQPLTDEKADSSDGGTSTESDDAGGTAAASGEASS